MRSVLYYTDSTQYGGAEHVLLLLLNGLDRAQWSPSLLHHPAPALGPLLDGADALDVPRSEIPPMPEGWRGAARAPGLAAALRRRRPHVFHAHLSWPHACKYGLFAAALAGVPAIVATEHLFVEVPRSRLAWWQQRLLSVGVHRYIMVSQEVADRYQAAYQLPEDKVSVIRNGIPLDPPRATAEAGAPVGWPSTGRPVVLTVARLDAQKGHRVLLEAAREVPGAEFVFAGTGAELPALEAMAASLGLSNRIHFLGYRADVPALLAACDLFVLPSRFEGLPLAVLEAMAAGRPVVATDIGGTREAVIHGETGLLVPPDDPAALARGIRRLLDDPAEAARLAAAGRTRARQEFAVEAMVRRVVGLYDELLGEDTGP